MASQSTGSTNPSRPFATTGATTGASTGHPGYYLLLAFKWTVSNSRFLYLVAAVLVGGSLLVTLYTDAWHWFQRSGALLVSIGALLSTRRALGLMLESMIYGGKLAQSQQDETAAAYRASELQTCVCGFLFVAMGTLIWAYGDLLGCLLSWDLSCLP